jgi:hypothetical protein
MAMRNTSLLSTSKVNMSSESGSNDRMQRLAEKLNKVSVNYNITLI